ncbi:MAG: GNAT family N-acetyltransferase [Parasporobacterium sp.]|nr:GNAT family N-acetyltransferase [Parasporobacterium sp.]
MIIKEIEFTVKDGRPAVLRNPREEDIPEILEYLKVSSDETKFLIRYPEEIRYTYEDEKELLNRVNRSENQVMLVCLVDNKIAGMCQISFETSIKTRHRASVAIALLKEFWGQGIGTRIFEELISIAESNPEVLQMELDFIEGNDRAMRLYEKMGFRIAGVHPDAIRLKDGTLLNEYLMIKKLR